jgi:hypothetical protein
MGVLLKIMLPLSDIGAIAHLIAGTFWLFVLPGWCIMLPWQKEFELLERAVIGILAAAGLFTIHIRIHTVLFPLLTIALSGAIALWRGKQTKKPA